MIIIYYKKIKLKVLHYYQNKFTSLAFTIQKFER